MTWLDANVKEAYLPKPNINYIPAKEAHEVPYINLIEVYRNNGDVAEIDN